MIAIHDAILDRIRSAGPGRVHTPKDFLDLAGRAAVDQTLSRLARGGTLRRLGRGLYHFPRVNERLGITVAADTDEVAAAVGRQTGSRLIPSGAVAANRLGLSTQVPAKPVYLSDGRSRRVRAGQVEIQVKHVSPKELPAGSGTSAVVFQALRHLGRAAVDDRVIGVLRTSLTRAQRRELPRDAKQTTDWIGTFARRIADERPNPAVAKVRD